MIKYSDFILFLGIICSVESSHTVTFEQFEAWKCSTICTSPNYEVQIGNICSWLVDQIQVNVPYTKKNIEEFGTCKDNTPMEFDSENGKVTGPEYRKKVAICYLSYDDTKCITKGSAYNTVFVWSYSSNKCHTPEQYAYVLQYPIREPTSLPTKEKKAHTVSSDTVQLPALNAYTVTPEQFENWQCSTICTSPNYEVQIGNICSWLVDQIQVNVPYAKKSIEEFGTCKDNTPMEFDSENGKVTGPEYRKKVAICYLSYDDTKCITKGPAYNTVFVWSYSSKKCHTPERFAYVLQYPIRDPTSLSTKEKKEDTVSPDTVQLPASNTYISSTPTAKGGKTATALSDQLPFSSTSDSSTRTTEEKGEPTTSETAQLPLSSISGSRTHSTEGKGDITAAESENSPVPKTTTLQRNESTMSAEKPLPSSPTLTQSPSKKQKCGCLTCWCAVVAWVKSLFQKSP